MPGIAGGLQSDRVRGAVRVLPAWTPPAQSRGNVTPLVGRDGEFAHLRELAVQAARGRGALAGLGGDAGIGKTRLASEIVAAHRADFTCLTGRAYATEGRVPFGMWVDALAPALAKSTPDALRRLLGTRTILKRVFPNLDASIGDTEMQLGAFDSSEHAKLVFFVAFRDLLHRLAVERPLIVLLDDVHAADQASLELLHFVARSIEAQRVLVLATYRTTLPLEPGFALCLESLRRNGVIDEIALRALDQQQTKEFVTGATGALAAPSVISRLHERTGGNPFFLAEVLRLGGLADASLERVPQSISQLVHERLDHLAVPARSLLSLAAVAGASASLSLLQRIAGLEQDELLAGVDELLRQGFVSERVERGRLRYAFTHPLFRDVVYDDLSETRRATLHDAIGRELSDPGFGEPVDPEELAYHLSRSANRQTRRLALPYLIEAAQHALELFANRDALDSLERAVDVLDESDPLELHRVVLDGLGKAQVRLGKFDQAIAAWTRALALEREPEQIAALNRRIGSACWNVGDEERAVRHFDAGLAALPAGDSAEVARLRQEIAAAQQRLGNPARSIEENLQSVAIAERLGTPELAGRGLVGLLTTYAVQGDIARGAEYGERAIALSSEARMAPVAWLAHSTLGALLRHHAETASATGHLHESLRIADAIGAQALQSWPLAALSDLSRCNGDLPAALAYGDRAVAIDRAYGQNGLLPRSLMFAALAHHMLGDVAVAREYADESLAMLRALRKQEIRIWSAVYGSAAALALEAGDATGAMHQGDGLLAHLAAHGWPALYVLDPFALPLRVEAAIRARELDDASVHLARLHELADRWSHGPATAAYHYLDALLGSAKGEAAPDAFEEALRRYASLGLRPAHAKVLLDKGNLLESLGRHDEAVGALADGLRAATEMQAAPLVEAFAGAQRAAGIKTRAPRKPGGVLTERETEVAELASRGLTNREIAESLSISLLTAETHVRNILRKSGLRSRAQLASYVT